MADEREAQIKAAAARCHSAETQLGAARQALEAAEIEFADANREFKSLLSAYKGGSPAPEQRAPSKPRVTSKRIAARRGSRGLAQRAAKAPAAHRAAATEAGVYACLEKAGRPMTAAEIAAAIGADVIHTRYALTGRETRKGDVYHPDRGLWGLTAWKERDKAAG